MSQSLSVVGLVLGTAGSFVGLLLSARALVHSLQVRAVRDADIVNKVNGLVKDMRAVKKKLGMGEGE